MSESAYRILVVVLLVLILIGVVADVAMQLVRGGDGGSFRQFGPQGQGQGGSQQRGPQRDQGQGWLPGLELSTA